MADFNGEPICGKGINNEGNGLFVQTRQAFLAKIKDIFLTKETVLVDILVKNVFQFFSLFD